MVNSNVYFLLGCPCSGKTTVGNILAQRYNMLYFSGDNRRFDYYKLAEKEKHSFMTMDASDFWDWSLDQMVAWEKGVISEQTPYILNDLNELSKSNELVLFEGMLDMEIVSKAVTSNQVVYLSVERSVCEREFFEREDHRGMLESILNTPNISEDEKRRRTEMRRAAAIDAFHVNAAEYGIQTFLRDETVSAQEMAEKVLAHFGLAKKNNS
ncbi:MAG: hypothetical protein E7554_06465 [Ruminococcaceae bacterium]|nr:hypothetical protein [Oscillospiraceae bacterium]